MLLRRKELITLLMVSEKSDAKSIRYINKESRKLAKIGDFVAAQTAVGELLKNTQETLAPRR